MFDVTLDENGVIRLYGKLDTAQAERLKTFFLDFTERAIAETPETTVVDCADLDYISSSGFGELFAAQKTLIRNDKALKLVNLSPHLRDLFGIAGFDKFFEIE